MRDRELCFQVRRGLSNSFISSGIVNVNVTVKAFAVKIKEITILLL